VVSLKGLTFRTPAPMPWDFRARAQPGLKLYDLGHLGLPPLHLSAFGGARGQALVLNLAPRHETAVRLLGAGRYYLLE
jgi:hypothetical protein